MIVLILFAFLAGLVTVLSPCILPVLPIVLSTSLSGGRRRPLGVVVGFIASFTFFTLFLTALVRLFGISADALRVFSVIVIFLFGASLLIPQFQLILERLFSKLSGRVSQGQTHNGFFGGILIGMSIGLLWTPCVGPILASIISLALTGSVTGTAVVITASYALGTAIPMLVIVKSGRRIFEQIPWLLSKTQTIQRVFGIIMMLMAIAIFFNADRTFQSYILTRFPQYGAGLTKFEDNQTVRQALETLGNTQKKEDMGKPMFELLGGQKKAPEFIEGGAWFNLPENSQRLRLEELKGKVVLVDFWTYTCINCIRTLPYLKSWHEKYRDKGLVVIGVHTPEFEFEKSAENVKEAIEDYGLDYPIMQDNNYATWRAYNNRYWPAKYLVDAEGVIRYHHFGEGDYDETEEAIHALLNEAGEDVSQTSIKNIAYSVNSRTPEIYLGHQRGEFFSHKIVPDVQKNYKISSGLQSHSVTLEGEWLVGEEYAMPSGGATLYLNFEAKEVFLVMRPRGKAIPKVKVYLDGMLISPSVAGEDVKNSVISIEKDRLYKLIKLPKMENHELKLEFIDGNIESFAFTFG